jgi:germacradienol/geosmin synthase
VNDLLTARLRVFGNVLEAGLPELAEEPGVGPVARGHLLAYARGLRDWQAGVHQWYLRSSRYAGSGGRLAGSCGGRHAVVEAPGPAPVVPLPDRGGFDPPAFSVPFPARVSPHLAAIRAHAARWASRHGLLEGGPWSAAAFEGADYGLFAALTHPDAPPVELALVADWHLWAFYVDDQVATGKRGRDLAGAQAFLDRLPAFLTDDPAAPTDPAERALVDLWLRSGQAMPAGLRAELADQVRDLLASWRWELANLAEGRVPDPVDYLEMRRRTAGAGFALVLARYADHEAVPAALLASRPLRALADAFADIGPLRNDIVSYRKEIEGEGELNNGVLAAQRFFGCELGQAVAILADLVDSRLHQFVRVTRELPGLAGEQRAAVERYVRRLQDWIAGDLEWSRRTGRYGGVPAPAAVGGSPAEGPAIVRPRAGELAALGATAVRLSRPARATGDGQLG